MIIGPSSINYILDKNAHYDFVPSNFLSINIAQQICRCLFVTTNKIQSDRRIRVECRHSLISHRYIPCESLIHTHYTQHLIHDKSFFTFLKYVTLQSKVITLVHIHILLKQLIILKIPFTSICFDRKNEAGQHIFDAFSY